MSNVQLHQYRDRGEYLHTQIERSRTKFGYCKVDFRDVLRYRSVLLEDGRRADRAARYAPILCLGVRSGAEVDMFRTVFFAWPMKLHAVREIAVARDTTKSAAHKIRLARRLGLGAGERRDGRVIGVEINPDCERADVVNCSFDELPAEWSGRFRILYSNSFDHSADPERTVREWRRVAAPGAYVIVACSPGTEPSATDPVGGLGLPALMALWRSPIVFASETLNRRYHEICFRLD